MWPFWSNAHSRRLGRPTALAAVEVIIAVAVSLFVAATVTRWVMLLSCFGVLLFFMRTSLAEAEGLRRCKIWQDRYLRCGRTYADRAYHPQYLVVAFLVASLFVVHMLWERLAVLLWAIRRDGKACINTMPSNFVAQMFIYDLAAPPELMPGIEGLTNEYGRPRLSRVLRDGARVFHATKHKSTKILIVPLGVLFVLLAYVPPTLLRLSIKGTCVIWLGLVWGAPLHEPDTEEYRRLPRSDQLCALLRRAFAPAGLITLVVSACVVGLFAWKLAMYNVAVIQGQGLPAPLQSFFLSLQAPGSAPLWHWTSAISSGLSLLYAGYALQAFLCQDDMAQPLASGARAAVVEVSDQCVRQLLDVLRGANLCTDHRARAVAAPRAARSQDPSTVAKGLSI